MLTTQLYAVQMYTTFTCLAVFTLLTDALPSSNPDSSVQQTTPPGAINALRDPSKRKYEIIGIVGAYLVWVAITILLVAFVGRRMRNRDQVPHDTMMKTFRTTERVIEVPATYDSPSLKSMKSPKSPGKFASLKSWGKKSHKSIASVHSTSTLSSAQEHEQHKARNMEDLANLYAVVMAHDEEKSQGRTSAATSPAFDTNTIGLASPLGSPLTSPGYPPEFAHLHTLQANANMTSHMLQSPKHDQYLHHPMAPTPIDDSFPQENHQQREHERVSRSTFRSTGSTPLSVASDISSRAPSTLSSKSRPSRISIRGQNISPPIGSGDLRDAHFYDDTVPLSPRVYTPGPAPPTPSNKKKKTIEMTVEAIHEHYPASPIQQQHYQQQQQQRHQAHLQQQLQLQQEQYLANNTTQYIAQNPTQTLPFRNMYSNFAVRSAPATKTTFLDRPMNLPTGPKTGVPQTPYSPYTPMTPMTPITPRRLMNRQELKAKRKEEKMKSLRDDDLVKEVDEVWGT